MTEVEEFLISERSKIAGYIRVFTRISKAKYAIDSDQAEALTGLARMIETNDPDLAKLTD